MKFKRNPPTKPTRIATDRIGLLESKRANVLGVFIDTMNDLHSINEELNQELISIDMRMAKLEADKELANKMFMDNAKIIGNIESIIKA